MNNTEISIFIAYAIIFVMLLYQFGLGIILAYKINY